jgi:hypothetical protein
MVLADLEIGEFEIGPVMQAWALSPVARRQPPPQALGQGLRDLGGGALHQLPLAPRTEHAVEEAARLPEFAADARLRQG